MEPKAIFPKGTLGKFNISLLLIGTWFFGLAGEAGAWPFDDPNFFPAGQIFYSQEVPNYKGLSDCHLGSGRVFSFNPTTSFRLSGIALFFFEDYNGQNSLWDPSRIKISLFTGGSFDPGQTLVFRSPFQDKSNTYNKALSLFGNGRSRGLFFELPPVWLSHHQAYTVLVECQNGSRIPHKIYSGSNSGAAQPFDSVNFIMGSAGGFKKPYFQLYSKNDGLSNVPPPGPSAPSSRPIILVHGLGGLPSDFETLKNLLAASGWDPSWLLSFEFGNKDDGTYNSFVEIQNLVPRLRAAVSTLSAGFRSQAGDGKIDLVGYSSGALIGRNYLAANKNSHLVRRFVAIGAPFKGSFLVDLEKGRNDFPGVSGGFNLNLGKLLLGRLTALKPLTLGRVPINEDFKEQLSGRGSPVLAYKKEDLPPDVSYFSLRGDIIARYLQNLFRVSVKKESSIGDGTVLAESAEDLPGVNAATISGSLLLKRSLTRSGATVSAQVSVPDLAALGTFHSNLLKSNEMLSKIISLLKN